MKLYEGDARDDMPEGWYWVDLGDHECIVEVCTRGGRPRIWDEREGDFLHADWYDCYYGPIPAPPTLEEARAMAQRDDPISATSLRELSDSLAELCPEVNGLHANGYTDGEHGQPCIIICCKLADVPLEMWRGPASDVSCQNVAIVTHDVRKAYARMCRKVSDAVEAAAKDASGAEISKEVLCARVNEAVREFTIGDCGTGKQTS